MAAHPGADKERGLEGNWSLHNYKRNGAEERQLRTCWRPVADCGTRQELGIGRSPPPATEKKNKQETGQTQDNEHNNKDTELSAQLMWGPCRESQGWPKTMGANRDLKIKNSNSSLWLPDIMALTGPVMAEMVMIRCPSSEWTEMGRWEGPFLVNEVPLCSRVNERRTLKRYIIPEYNYRR